MSPMEQHDLTTPIPASGGTSLWKPRHIVFHYDDDDSSQSYIKIGLVGENGETKSVGYSGSAAHSLIQFLNTVDLSTNSLQKRILQKLATDNLIGAGTISGTPDV